MSTPPLSSVGHDLRTPLNAIIGFAQLLEAQTGGPLNDRQRKYVSNIETSGRQLLELLDHLVDLTSVESPMAPPVIVADVDSILRDLQPMLHGLLERKTVTLALEIPDGMPPVTVDRAQVKQALSCLLRSAIMMTRAGGQVRVAARRVEPSAAAGPGAWVEMAVRAAASPGRGGTVAILTLPSELSLPGVETT